MHEPLFFLMRFIEESIAEVKKWRGLHSDFVTYLGTLLLCRSSTSLRMRGTFHFDDVKSVTPGRVVSKNEQAKESIQDKLNSSLRTPTFERGESCNSGKLVFLVN